MKQTTHSNLIFPVNMLFGNPIVYTIVWAQVGNMLSQSLCKDCQNPKMAFVYLSCWLYTQI